MRLEDIEDNKIMKMRRARGNIQQIGKKYRNGEMAAEKAFLQLEEMFLSYLEVEESLKNEEHYSPKRVPPTLEEIGIPLMEKRFSEHMKLLWAIEKDYKERKISAEQAFFQIKERTGQILETELALAHLKEKKDSN